MDGRAFDGLVDTFFDAATSANEDLAWSDVVRRLCNALHASAGGLLVHSLSRRSGTLWHVFNISVPYRAAYDAELPAKDPWVEPLISCPEGMAAIGSEILADSEMISSAFYGAWLKPQNLRHGLFGVIVRGGRDVHMLQMFRPPTAPAFTSAEKTTLAELLPQLRRAISVHLRSTSMREARDRLAAMMDLLPIAFLLVGQNGHVERLNAAARAMVAQGNGLFVGAGGYLATSSLKSTTELRRALSEVVDKPAAGPDASLGRHVIISRGPGRLPLIAVVFPLDAGQGENGGLSSPAVALLVKDPQSEPFDGAEDFAQAFRLTKAETRIFGQLKAGNGLLEAAARLGVSRNTARTHMRHIYSKVGTHRQADLIRLSARFSLF